MSILNTVGVDDSYQKTSALPSSSEASATAGAQETSYNSGAVNAAVRDDSSNTASADKHTSAADAASVASAAQAFEQKTIEAEQEASAQTSTTSETTAESAEELIGELNSQNLGLSFTIDEELDDIVISVMDRDTDEVVRQIPSEEFQRFSKAIQSFQDEASTTDGVLSSSSKSALKGLILEDKV